MGRQPCCDKVGLKRGPWTIEEDNKLMNFILNNGIQCWRLVPKLAGLLRCGKSCRLRWINYLRPDLKRGAWTEAEEDLVIQLHSRLGNRWSKIATHFPGRTDNEIKNHWNTKIKKKLKLLGLDPLTHKPLNHEKSDHDQDQEQGMIQEYYSTTSSSGEQRIQQQGISTEETTLMMNNNTADQLDDQKKSSSSSSNNNDNDNNNLACMFMEMKPSPACSEMNGNGELLLDSFYLGIGHHHQSEDSFHNWINSPLPWDLFTSSDDNFL